MKNMNRRHFLAATTVASTALAFPFVGRVLGANAKLNIGVVGVAGRGASNLAGVKGENIVALCDVDAARLAGAAKQFPKAKGYVDFRKMLERKDLDAVVCSTPDHTHAIVGVSALKSGRHLYCESVHGIGFKCSHGHLAYWPFHITGTAINVVYLLVCDLFNRNYVEHGHINLTYAYFGRCRPCRRRRP